MSSVIDRIRAKITGAMRRTQDFQLALEAFSDTKPHAVATREDKQSGKRIYYVSKADPVPDSVADIAADAIRSLRSPLDELAYQLVLAARGGAEPDWLVDYPVSGSATDYRATLGGKIKGVRQEVIAAIDATEPYKSGKGHALWQLNELNKRGKDIHLVGAGSFYSSVDISGTFNLMLEKTALWDGLVFPPLFLKPADKLFPMKVGDELYVEPIDLEVHKNRRFSFDVSFDVPGIVDCQPAPKTLQDISTQVDEIVARLGRLLP
jgi:hypothetical protein